MTAQEINDVYLRDEAKIKAYVYHRNKELRRVLLKNKVDRVRRSYAYHTDNTDYILIVTYLKNGTSSCGWYMYSKETNEFFTRLRYKNVAGVVSFSMHLIKRFAERALKDRDLPIDKILLKFSDQLIGTLIYDKDDIFASACFSGLLLGKNDKKRGIVIHKTFVSLDMLKDTQMSAWEKVSKFLKAAKIVKDKFGINSLHLRVAQELMDKDVKLSDKEAKAIYETYYEK